VNNHWPFSPNIPSSLFDLFLESVCGLYGHLSLLIDSLIPSQCCFTQVFLNALVVLIIVHEHVFML